MSNASELDHVRRTARRAAPRVLRDWRWWIPPLAIVLFAGATATLLWMTYARENQDRNEQIIGDTLWVKQSIEFQLERHQEALHNFAIVAARGQLGDADFQARARVLINGDREILRIAEVRADGGVLRFAAPSQTPTSTAEHDAAWRAIEIGDIVFTQPASETGPALLMLAVPIAGQNSAVVATYSLQGILDEMVPWWFAQDNQVSIANAFGEPLVTREAAGPPRGVYHHQSPLDLPGTTLLLMTDSVKTAPSVLPNVLTAAVALLALTLIVSLYLLWQDVRQRLAAEHQLSAELSFRQAMEESLVTGLRARDLSGRVTYVNRAFCEIVGYGPEEVVGQTPPMPYWDAEHFDDYQRRFATVLDGTVTRQGYETVFRKRTGELINVLIFEAPLIGALGKQTGWMSSVLDITDLKRIEEINRQQQEKLQSTARLAVMGEMASTLSHELNQPLSAITSYVTGCINMVPASDGLLRPALEKIQRQAARAGQIIRSVHDFVRRREPYRAPVSIDAVIEAAMPLMQLQARKAQVHIECRIAPDLPPVLAEQVMLEQVLLNLSRNAIEAMADEPAERRVLEIGAVANHAAIEVAVVDHGYGIADDDAGRLFSPFFTTKAEGMGMGLNICRTTVESHRGRLWYEPTPGGGTTFKFTLPT